jgi:CheY-like chemotaxis protein
VVLGEDTRFDAIVCDVVMPDRTGLDVLATIRARWPDLAVRVLLITGGSISRAIDEGVAASGAPVLRKPFSFADLESALATLVPRV